MTSDSFSSGSLEAGTPSAVHSGDACVSVPRAEGSAQLLYATTPDLEKVLGYLYGVEDMDGVSFGDVPPGKPRYWWRSKLREALKVESAAIRRQALEDAAKDARENLPAEIEKGLMEFYEKGLAGGLELAAKVCDAADKSTHPADLAAAIRACGK